MRGSPSKDTDSSRIPSFRPGTLWSRIVERSRLAIERGALRNIDTEQLFVTEAGVEFVVRAVSNLARKEKHDRTQHADGADRGPNPFSPPEPELLVAAASDSHWAVLNKFNVLDHHLLLVTRKFEHQETLLNTSDFDALWRCLNEYAGLGFYNGGAVAGASQAHKHLQLVPLPLADKGPPIPIETALPTARDDVGPAGLPFRHAFATLEPTATNADALHERYKNLLDKTGITALEGNDGMRQSMPYNLLVTREWMLLVPRSRECFDTISVNALGFAGSFFVKESRQFRIIEQTGPMSVLSAVALPSR